MTSHIASKKKLLQFYLFDIASQEAVFEALFEAMPKDPKDPTKLPQPQRMNDKKVYISNHCG